MKRPPQPRKVVDLSASIHQQLNLYGLAATAAGVSTLALAQPAQAKIVYTPANTPIPCVSKVNLDLNHDGNPDFVFFNQSGGVYHQCWLDVLPTTQGNQILGTENFAAALKAGARIGASSRFSASHDLMAAVTAYTQNAGQWVNVNKRYLGLEFKIHGKTHFGWARLNVAENGVKIIGKLTGYAYETVPNKSIVAGKTDGSPGRIKCAGQITSASQSAQLKSLGQLAQGATGTTSGRVNRP